MPTSLELRSISYSWLDSLIGRNGGLIYWADRLNLPTKHHRGNKLTENEISNEILETVEQLNTQMMPSSTEIISHKGNVLHNNICRSGGYRVWADKLGLALKESETQLGQDYELTVINILKNKGFTTKKMTTGHPFDLLINDTVKTDVKVSRPHLSHDTCRIHSFGINKKYGSCDIYIIVALDEKDNIERLLIIPSHLLRVTTLCIGENSKYNKYLNRYDYIEKYSSFLSQVK